MAASKFVSLIEGILVNPIPKLPSKEIGDE